MNRRLFKFTLASLPLLIAAPTWAADAFPSKSIKVIVPYPAGGVVDVQTRVVTQAMEQFLKQAMVVEPRPGASGSIAAFASAACKAGPGTEAKL